MIQICITSHHITIKQKSIMGKSYKSFILYIFLILAPCISQAQVLKQGSLTVVENDTRPFIDTLDYTKLTEQEQKVGMAVQDFSFQFFKKMYEMKSKEHSLVMSPYSLRQLLSIVCNGTAGKTRHELCKLMNITPSQVDILNTYNKKLEWMTKNTGKDVTLKSTSSVWVQERFPIFRTFMADSRNYYNADVRAVNFSEKATAQAINKWCADKTNGLIPHIVEEKPMDYLLFMANALYFNALWTGNFSKASTHKADFKNADGSVSQVDMMWNNELTGAYFSDEDCDFLRLGFNFGISDKDMVKKPYSIFSLVICLPHKGISLDGLVNKLDHEHWIDAIKKTKTRPVDVKLPRFETRLNVDAKGVMQQMAPLSLFKTSGDYSLLSPNNDLRVSGIQQNAVVKVDEKGCEAAAVTYSNMVGDDCDPWAPKPIPFYVDHPFIFAIQENGSSNILFLGAVKHL